MNRQLKNFGSLVGLAVLSASISVGLSGCPSNLSGNGGEKKVVNVAANIPITGDLAVYGVSVRNGGTMALEDLSKSDTTGLTLNFDWQDNASDPKQAVSIFQKQALGSPSIYVSGVKPQTMAIIKQVSEKGIPHFVWIFDVFINQNSQNNLRTWVNYKIEPSMYFKYVEERKPKRVAILYVLVPHTEEEFKKIVIPRLKDQGIEVFAESYDFGTKDYKDIANKVKNFNPDLIILNGFQNTLVGLIKALRPLGLITDGNTIGTYDVIDAATVLGKDEIEGIRVVAPVFVTRPEKEKVVKWSERFSAKFGKVPLYTDAYAYDMVMIIHDAAKRLTLPASSGQWIEAIRATKIDGITGSLSFDKDGDLVTPLEIGVFRNGKLIPDQSLVPAK